jgi:hypothetical protein
MMTDKEGRVQITEFDVALNSLVKCQARYVQEIRLLKESINVFEEERVNNAKHVFEFIEKNELLEKEVYNLQNKISELEKSTNTHEHEQHTEQQTELQSLRNENESLKQKLESSAKALEPQISTKLQNEHVEDVLEFIKKNNRLEKEVYTFQDKIHNLEKEIKHLKREHMKELAKCSEDDFLRKENESLKQELEKSAVKILDLEKENDRLKSESLKELEKSVTKILDLDNEIHRLKSDSLKEQEKSDAKILDLEKEIDHLKSEQLEQAISVEANTKSNVSSLSYKRSDQYVDSYDSRTYANGRTYYIEDISYCKTSTYLYFNYGNIESIIIPKIHRQDTPRFIKNVIDYCIENKCIYVGNTPKTTEVINFTDLKQDLQKNGKLIHTWEFSWYHSSLSKDNIIKLKSNMSVVKSYVIHYLNNGNIEDDSSKLKDMRLIFEVIKNMHFSNKDKVDSFKKKILENVVTFDSNPDVFISR